jgi:enoyl-CoA hydratase/carnithine racemase
MYQTIQYATDALVATITLNRPERKNALSSEMVNELLYALEGAMRDENVRVVVIGANGKAFSAGGDLGQMSGGGGPASELPVKGDYADLLLALARAIKPVVAKVNGPAMGGGFGLVTACTMAVMSSDAQLGTPEINVGLWPMMIMAILARTMPRRPLLEMMLLAQKLSADDALRLGLVNRVVPADRLDVETKALADQLAQKSPTALARGLAAYATMGDLSLAESLPWLRDQLYELLGTEDAREGLMAFMEKRAPRWTGR